MKTHKVNKSSSYIYIYISVILSSLTLLSASFLSSSTTFADDSIVDQVNVTVAASCTLSGTGMDSHNAEIANGTYRDNIGTTTLKAFCNDSEGFAIYAIGFTGDQYTGEDHTKLIGTNTNQKIVTGTNTSGTSTTPSNWAMKLTTNSSSTYPIELDNSYDDYNVVPDTYTKVAHRNSSTDVGASATGAELTTTYAAYISSTQIADTYTGKVKYTLVHPASEEPLQPQPASPGKIVYHKNASDAIGTMADQSASNNANVMLYPSNFSRTGYGFAGWSTTFDYSDENGLYGPMETITTPSDVSTNGLSLYAIWVKSAGNLQDWNGCSSLNQGDVTALTDTRDNDTYAVAKLADGKCWMIENLRLDDSATLTLANTNNPLNDGTNVTLKHNYDDTTTHNTLSPNSDVAYNATTAPNGWCDTYSAACDDQSRLRTDNTANRSASTTNSTNVYSYGNYYNWYSATAGRGTYGFSTNNDSVAGDLCPKGWHLPIGGRKANVDVSDFWKLSRATIGSDPANFTNDDFYYTGTPEGVDASRAMRSYPNNFVYSGDVYGGSVQNRSYTGGYWSSTAFSSVAAYYLYFSNSNVYPGMLDSYKFVGWAVRCVR